MKIRSEMMLDTCLYLVYSIGKRHVLYMRYDLLCAKYIQ
jgi:hypothetical protein